VITVVLFLIAVATANPVALAAALLIAIYGLTFNPAIAIKFLEVAF